MVVGLTQWDERLRKNWFIDGWSKRDVTCNNADGWHFLWCVLRKWRAIFLSKAFAVEPSSSNFSGLRCNFAPFVTCVFVIQKRRNPGVYDRGIGYLDGSVFYSGFPVGD